MLQNRLLNIVSAVVAAGIAVGCVSAYNCGSVKEIDLQSPSLLGPDAVPFEDLFYGQDLQAEETAYIPVSMGNFDINDYTIIAVASYSDIASEFGTDPSDPITYDGGIYWILTDAVLVSAKTDKAEDEEDDDSDDDDNENEDTVTELKLGDTVTRISYTREWSLIKLADGKQGYVMSSHLSPTKVDPEAEATPIPTEDTSSSDSDSEHDTPSYTYDDDDDDNYEEPEDNSSSTPAKDYEEWDVDFTVYSTTALNTRTGPGISYTLLSTLSTGTAIDVVAETDNGWYKSADGYYVKASYTSDTKPTPTPVPIYYDDDDDGDDSWSDFASYIRSFIGCSYVYGGADPSGFDCSGFVMYCYQTYYGIYLPHGATSQSYKGYEVSASEIQVGDIICFDKNGDGTMEHSALYVGNNKYVHAQSSATGVVESNFSSATGIATIRRVL